MFAATVLATYDEDFYNDYKGMIELMLRDYANPSGSDNEYCRFRAYDMYEGHSWAGGYGDNNSGNNQESASEATFAWAGLYLWGLVTENKGVDIVHLTAEKKGVKYEIEVLLHNFLDFACHVFINSHLGWRRCGFIYFCR